MMLELKVFKGREIFDSGLVEPIVEFDKQNMKFVREKAGIEFPEEKRRLGLLRNPTFVIAFDNQKIAGYIEFCRDWENENYIYISSIQIDKKYRNSRLILALLDAFRSLAAEEDFLGFLTNLQKTNQLAARIYRKLGFTLEDKPGSDISYVARAGREILQTSPIIPLLDEWRRKRR